ncbi:MAG TPA: M20 family metallopeptidase [Solirubrobacter sp.]|nr:M20 family metallopeptidase [Solirubrobacter sp.]
MSAVRDAIDPDRCTTAVQEAIRIPSVFGDEQAVGEYLAELMRGAGLGEVERQEVQPGRANVIGTLDTGRPGPTLVLQGHMDTVPPGEHPEPFSGAVHDGAIWGRGASDMKGPLVAAILAVEAARRAGELAGRVIVAATVDEESEKRGMFALVDRGLQADFGICVEPTDLRVAVAQKGCVSLRVTTHGVAAHGANPDQGVNAIRKLARIVEAIEAAELPAVEIAGVGPVTGTYNVGVIAGGQMFFIVPDRASIWVDRRTTPAETQDEALAALRALVHAIDPEAEVEVDRQDWSWPRIRERGIGSCSVERDSPVVRAVVDGVAQATGRPAELYVQTAWCETDFLVNDLGIPTVNLGPGRMELAHTSTEHIAIDSLLAGVEALALAVRSICAPS